MKNDASLNHDLLRKNMYNIFKMILLCSSKTKIHIGILELSPLHIINIDIIQPGGKVGI